MVIASHNIRQSVLFWQEELYHETSGDLEHGRYNTPSKGRIETQPLPTSHTAVSTFPYLNLIARGLVQAVEPLDTTRLIR